MPPNFFVAAITLREVEVGSTSCNDVCNKKRCELGMLISGHVTQSRQRTAQRNQLRDKLQAKLPSVTTPKYHLQRLVSYDNKPLLIT